MPKTRYQVLLSDWMGDYVKFIAKKYSLTTSDVIRGHMCFGFLSAISMMYPEYSAKLEEKEFVRLAGKMNHNSLNDEEFYQLTSKIIFEARKAVEFRLSKKNEQFEERHGA